MYQSLAHTKWCCKYHVVIVPKYRRKILYGKYRKEIGKIIRELCEYKGIEIIKAHACIDHIHMCISIAPKYKVSDVMAYIKGKSALRLFDKFPELKNKVNGKKLWTRGYFVSTVGLDIERIKKYIEFQESYEKNMD